MIALADGGAAHKEGEGPKAGVDDWGQWWHAPDAAALLRTDGAQGE